MNSGELVSVILPVYNGERYISGAISSILSQSYRSIELIVLDDGSTDGTLNILSSIKDVRLKILAGEHKGLVWQLNHGIKEAQGTYIARMDADDIALPDRLEKQVSFLQVNKDVHLTGTNYYHIDEAGKIIEEKKMPELHNEIEYMMPVTASVLHPTMLTYKSVLEEVGGYNVEMVHSEDHELFLRILQRGFKMHNIREPLYHYRVWKGSSSEGRRNIQRKNVYTAGLKYLEGKYEEKGESFDYYFRSALLEYYRGSMGVSRSFLIKALKSEPGKWRRVARYLPLSLLGDGIVNFLRNKGILSFISRMINRSSGTDLNIVKRV